MTKIFEDRNPDQGERQTDGAFGLKEIVPSDATVHGPSLLQAIIDAIHRHVSIEPDAALAVALWIIHAHVIYAATHSPRLYITSPQRGCGKTTLLHLIGFLVPRPLETSNVTAPVIFRTVDEASPTLLLDEADTFIGADSQIIGVLNAGYETAGSTVRLVGDKHAPRVFRVYCAVAIAAIGKLPQTIVDRSVKASMRRCSRNEKPERLTPAARMKLEQLASDIARFALDNGSLLENEDPMIPEALGNRQGDSWRPLLAIADICGGHWPANARSAAERISGQHDHVGIEEQLLADTRSIFGRWGKVRITSADLHEELLTDEGMPWGEYNMGRPISRRQVASKLAAYGIEAKTIRSGARTDRGYERVQFEDAWSRYLPPENITTSQGDDVTEDNGTDGLPF